MNGVTAYVGLGSNLEQPAEQIRSALAALHASAGICLQHCSSFYGNPPMGPQDQPDYINAVAEIRSSLAPGALLASLQAIERAQGRVRSGQRWGPRTIDLDLLLYGDQVVNEPGLTVPHPGIAERSFVLLPLQEIAPQLCVPGLGPVTDLLAGVDLSNLVALEAATENLG